MSIIAQFPATDTYAVVVATCGDQYSATIVDRTGASLGGVVRRSENHARAAANNAWTNLRNGHRPVRENGVRVVATDLFTARCVQCGKAATTGRPLLNGRQGLTHDTCDNYR